MTDWFLHARMTEPSRLIDLDGEAQPVELPLEPIALAPRVAEIVGDSPVTMDITGVGLAVADRLLRAGVVVLGYRPIRLVP